MSGLFGGEETKTKDKPGQVVNLTPEAFAGLQGPLADVLKKFMQGGPEATAVGAAPEQLVSGPSNLTQNIAQTAGRSALAPSPEQQAASALLGRTLQGDFLMPGSNPFLAATIEAAQRPITTAFNESVVPNLLSRFTAAGQQVQGEGGSSAFARAAGLGSTNYLAQLADISTNLAGQNYQSERGRMQDAIGQSQTISNQEMERMTQGLEASALPAMMRDLGVQRGLEQYNERMKAVLAALQIAAGSTQPTVATTSGGGSSSSQTKPNIFETLFPYGLSGGPTA